MKTLNVYQTTEADILAWPEATPDLTINSPALLFFTDFNQVEPLVIDSSIAAIEVKRLMQKAHVKTKLVVNQAGTFIGLISTDDLIDRKIVQKVSEGSKREDIALEDLMIPRRKLKALDYTEITNVSIATVINTLKESGEQHCLVIDRQNHKIRGFFSASDISRKLHLPINIQNKSNFYKVFAEAG